MLTNRKAEGRRPRVFTEQERMQKLLISKWNMKVFPDDESLNENGNEDCEGDRDIGIDDHGNGARASHL